MQQVVFVVGVLVPLASLTFLFVVSARNFSLSGPSPAESWGFLASSVLTVFAVIVTWILSIQAQVQQLPAQDAINTRLDSVIMNIDNSKAELENDVYTRRKELEGITLEAIRKAEHEVLKRIEIYYIGLMNRGQGPKASDGSERG